MSSHAAPILLLVWLFLQGIAIMWGMPSTLCDATWRSWTFGFILVCAVALVGNALFLIVKVEYSRATASEAQFTCLGAFAVISVLGALAMTLIGTSLLWSVDSFPWFSPEALTCRAVDGATFLYVSMTTISMMATIGVVCVTAVVALLRICLHGCKQPCCCSRPSCGRSRQVAVQGAGTGAGSTTGQLV